MWKIGNYVLNSNKLCNLKIHKEFSKYIKVILDKLIYYNYMMETFRGD